MLRYAQHDRELAWSLQSPSADLGPRVFAPLCWLIERLHGFTRGKTGVLQPANSGSCGERSGIRKRDRRCLKCCNKGFEFRLGDDGFRAYIHRTHEIPQR